MIPEKFTISDFYNLCSMRGLGNNVWYDNLEEILKRINTLLKQKYSDNDFRILFLKKIILKAETHEVDVEEEEYLRSLLHNEVFSSERDDTMETLQMLILSFEYQK